MAEGLTERVHCAELLQRLTALLSEGWLVRSVQIDTGSVGSPGDWTAPEDYQYWVRVQRLLPDEKEE